MAHEFTGPLKDKADELYESLRVAVIDNGRLHCPYCGSIELFVGEYTWHSWPDIKVQDGKIVVDGCSDSCYEDSVPGVSGDVLLWCDKCTAESKPPIPVTWGE